MELCCTAIPSILIVSWTLGHSGISWPCSITCHKPALRVFRDLHEEIQQHFTDVDPLPFFCQLSRDPTNRDLRHVEMIMDNGFSWSPQDSSFFHKPEVSKFSAFLSYGLHSFNVFSGHCSSLSPFMTGVLETDEQDIPLTVLEVLVSNTCRIPLQKKLDDHGVHFMPKSRCTAWNTLLGSNVMHCGQGSKFSVLLY